MIINEQTPIEKYHIKDRDIYVKREDLSCNYPAPFLSKLRGVYKRLEKVRAMGYKKIGVFDTRISKAGWGVSAIAQELGGLEVFNFYPHLKQYKETPYNQQKVLELGGKLFPMEGGRTAVLYALAKRIMEQENIYIMPLGLCIEETFFETKKIAEKIEDFLGGSLVVCIGSGMITSGIAAGLSKKLKNIYAISAGMSPERQFRRIKNFIEIPENLTIIKSQEDYYYQEKIETPFPCSEYYDKKAWRWLLENLEKLTDPILFWNIGV